MLSKSGFSFLCKASCRAALLGKSKIKEQKRQSFFIFCGDKIQRGSVRTMATAVEAPPASMPSSTSAVQEEYMKREHCILLDDNDKVIGSDTKMNCHRVEQDAFKVPHRAFSVFLFNKDNRYIYSACIRDR